DLDGTLIKSTIGVKKGPKASPLDWAWWRDSIPKKLKEVLDAGYAVVIISNQGIRSAQLDSWKKKIALIANALPDVPFHLFAATAKDGHRKPMPGMWREVEDIFGKEGVQIDKEASFYVGDAAGRPGDFAATDRKFALNVGIKFYTPEEYFLNLPSASYELQGFHVSSLKPSVHPPLSAADIASSSKRELVLFVGLPCLGKSTFYRKHFAPAGYVRVNQDTLGSRPKCIKAAEEALSQGKSCVIADAEVLPRSGEEDKDTRKVGILLSHSTISSNTEPGAFSSRALRSLRGITIYIAHTFTTSRLPSPSASALPETPCVLALTVSSRQKRDFVPYMAFTGFSQNYEEPKIDEGFASIQHVPWVFEGTEEEEKRWSMWLQIDGK
ncbi:hypothetical protein EVG20_g4266, partial [Dentipellis fragilis]